MPLTSKISPVTEQLFTANVGSTIFLKACSFVEEEKAKILDVREDYLEVRVGYNWIERLLFQCDNRYPAIVTLAFSGPISDEVRQANGSLLPAVRCSQVDITIQPDSPRWKEADFRQFCRRLLWGIRQHFISP